MFCLPSALNVRCLCADEREAGREQAGNCLFAQFNTIQLNTFPYAADRTQGRGKPGTEREAEDAERV